MSNTLERATRAPSAVVLRLPPLATITQQAVDETIKQVREGYSNKAGVKASTAEGGQGRVFLAISRGQMEAAGYVGWKRRAGIEAGGEVTWDLTPR